MIVLYALIGGVVGFILYAELGLLIGITTGCIFSIGQSLEKKYSGLEQDLQKMDVKLNNEIVARKQAVESLKESNRQL